MEVLRTVIVEDDGHYRKSLEELLRHSPGLELAHSFGCAEDLLRCARQSVAAGGPRPWDICLLDIGLPGQNGIEAAGNVKRILPEVPVVMLTVFEDPARIVAAIACGADGYLLKSASPDEIAACLRAVASGAAVLTPAVARKVLSLARRGLPDAAPDLGLTPRERDVLAALVRGSGYRQAAHELEISIDTVRAHIRSIYKKLQVHSVAEAVVRAVREGIV